MVQYKFYESGNKNIPNFLIFSPISYKAFQLCSIDFFITHLHLHAILWHRCYLIFVQCSSILDQYDMCLRFQLHLVQLIQR